MKKKAVIFFDDECGMCHWSVRYAYRRDKKGAFFFAPLNGKTSEQYLTVWKKAHPDVDSIVLLEPNGAISYYSKAVFTILWHLGFPFSLVGILHFLPKPLLYPFDLLYRVVARYRPKSCPVNRSKPSSHQFLP